MGALVTPAFTTTQRISFACAGADATASFTLAGGAKRISIVATAAVFVNFEAPASAAASATGFPIQAGVVTYFEGPIVAVHANGTATVVVHGVA
jgi:hypothetical protein